MKQANIETWLVINKVDNVKDKQALLPHLEWLGSQHDFNKIMPISAKQGKGVEGLRDMVRESMDESEFYFPEDYITDRSERFMAAEIIR